MRSVILAVLLLVASCSGAEYKCLNQTGRTFNARPDTLLPLNNYTVTIRTTDFVKSVSSETRETKLGNTVGIIKQTRADNSMQWIFRDNDYIFHDGKNNCSAFPKWTESATNPTPYEVPAFIATTLGLNATSVEGLLKQYKEGKTPLFNTSWLDDTDMSTVGGVPAAHWVSCFNVITDRYIEVDVAFGNSTILPADIAISEPVLLQIVMRAYEVKANVPTLTDHYTLEISSVHNPCTEVQEKFFLPPKGVYCNVTSTKAVPAFPDKFEVRLQYADIVGKRFDTTEVVYDKVNKVIGYSLDVAQNTDEPFIGNLSVGTGHIRVVHDFGSGIEYVLSGKGDHCNAVNPLPRSGGDVAPGTGRLEMKNATDFMLGCNSSEFVYLGQRTTDAGLPADVFISKALTNVTDKEQKVISVKTTVTELWYSLSDWTIENRLSLDKTVTLLEIRQYHYTENAPVSRTVQKIQSIVDYTGRSTPWSHFTVASCLKLVDDSYLFMLIKTTLAEITAVGLNNFQDGLAEHVAKIANVSALRFVGNFVKEIKIDSDTHIAAFFNLGDVSAVSGANETSLKDARDAINKTVSAGSSAEFVVFDDSKKETKFTIAQKALGDIPSTWNGQTTPPEPVKRGYSGGSMFVLALFMLVIGAAIGVGVAFFLWKRQRGGGGGLSYQVFE